MSATTLLVALTCLVSFSGLARGAPCPGELCEDVVKRDGEKIRAAILAGTPNLCKCRCKSGDRLLHDAAAFECVTCADVLMSPPSNCKPDSNDFSRTSPLADAAKVCNSPLVNVFLDNGANPNRKNKIGNTPLCLAARLDSENCGGVVKDLVAKGADICLTCGGKTPLEIAANQITKDVLVGLGGQNVEDGGTCP